MKKVLVQSLSRRLMLAIALMAVGLTAVQAQAVKYEFKPPQNNFYYKWKTSSGTYYAGYINGGLWRDDGSGQTFSTSDGKTYYYYEGKWRLDGEADSGDVRAWLTQHLTEPDFLGSYYEYFWERYNAAAGGTLRASLYHKGKERFLGINCDIFVDNLLTRYWIDPANGCTLKRVSADGKEVEEILEYNLNFTRWPAGLPPQVR
jgi:hypothetical protein